MVVLGVVVTHDGQASGTQLLEIRPFVRESTFAQILKDHVEPDGPLDLTASRSEVERGQMTTTEKVTQVRGGANKSVSGLFHSVYPTPVRADRSAYADGTQWTKTATSILAL